MAPMTPAPELDLDLQIAVDETPVPARDDFERWVTAGLSGQRERAQLTIRLVDQAESAELNARYRGIDQPTNVLSFPFELPPGMDPRDPLADYLGDLVICAPVVLREAGEQGKESAAHWAHMVIHGVLHLLDYDHITDEDAARMEGLERELLHGLGWPSPYED